MTDKKLTDKEIIKALEYCKDCSANLNVEIIDFITRQKAENENLKVENQSLRTAANSLKMHYEKAQAEIEKLEKESNDKERAYNDEFCLRKEWQTKCRELLEEKQTTQSEAVKKFAERLDNETFDVYYAGSLYHVVDIDDVKEILKEMVGDSDDS